MHRSRDHYRDLVDEDLDDIPRTGNTRRSTGSGSGTVNQPGGSQSTRGRVRHGAAPRHRGHADDDDESLPPPPPNEALIERIHMILRTPGRIKKKLDPRRPDGTYWFNVDSKVARTVTEAIKAHFPRGYYNWRDATDQTIRDQWFELWTKQYWTWDEAHTSNVRQEFEMKACKRLSDIVHRWKLGWLAAGDEAMPFGMDPEAWNGLVTYWRSRKGQKNAESASRSRNTPVSPGDVSSRHRLGQMPMAGLRLKMAKESESGELPPVIDVYERAYRRPDGSYVTKTAEKVHMDYEVAVSQAVMERESQGDSSATPMTTEDYDNIYKKVAPKKKGRTLGMGSIDEVPACSSSSQHHRVSREAAMQAELAELRRFRDESITRESAVLSALQIIAGDNPVYMEAVRNIPRVAPVPSPTEAQVNQHEANLRATAGIPDVDLANRNTF